jgi:penicillin-binding protein 1A
MAMVKSKKSTTTKKNVKKTNRNAPKRKVTRASGGKKKKPKKKQQNRSLWLSLLKWFVIFGMWGIIIGGLAVMYYAHDLPDTSGLSQEGKPGTVRLLSREGTLLAKVVGERGTHLAFNEFPKTLIDAVIATEDRRFFDHFGADVFGLARAMYTNFKAGYVRQGGSTITQQLAKIAFLSPKRTLKRKVQELLLALWLEHNFTKEQIITMYLNRAYFGAGAFGVDSAARTYFNKPAHKMTLTESAMIAGLLKAPSKYSPFSNRKLATSRMHQVLANMVDAGFLRTVDAIGQVKTIKPRPEKALNKGRYFVDWVSAQIPSYIGISDSELTVRTTLSVKKQQAAEKYMTQYVGKKPYQGALVSMSTDGEVLAMVGGESYKNSQYNRATQAMRQPGSAFKLFVYLAALEHGFIPSDELSDKPVRIGKWAPQNYGETYRGQVSLADAFAASINTVAVQLSETAKRSSVIEMAYRLGIRSDLQNHPSIALGVSEVSLLDMTGAFAHVANGGKALAPFGILEIRDKDNTVLYEHESFVRAPRVVTEKVARQMHGMLRNVVQYGTGKNAKFSHDVAGKTGTSQDFRDAWFVGYTAHMVTGVWVGNDNNSPMDKVTGGNVPAKMFKAYMQDSHKNLKPKSFSAAPASSKKNWAKPQSSPKAQDERQQFWDTIN